MINTAVDYDNHFPPGYGAGHTAGLKLLRVAARARADCGREKVGLYEAIGAQVLDTGPDERQDRGSRTFLEPILAGLGLPSALPAWRTPRSTLSCSGKSIRRWI